MALNFVSVNLDRLEWSHLIAATGGGGFDGGAPTASPYLWTVFFKADGTTLQLTDAGTLSGSATVFFTPGSHGNLGTSSVQAGNSIIIPDDIGQWTSVLEPIPIASSLRQLLGRDSLPAYFGAVAVLMKEGGHIPNHAAEDGHSALNNAVQSALDAILRSIGQTHPMVTQQDIDSIAKSIPQKVHDAIKDAMSFWEKLWAISGPDSEVGHKVWVWNRQDFMTPLMETPIGQQFGPDSNLWSIFGRLRVSDLCATSARIQVSKRGKSHCTNNSLINGEPGTLTVRIGGFPDLPTRYYTYDWSVIGADALGSTNQSTFSVKIQNNVQQISTSVTITDNLGCKIVQQQTFPVLTPQAAASIDSICILRDKMSEIINKLPSTILHPAGPDPGPLAHELQQDATKLVQLIGRLKRL